MLPIPNPVQHQTSLESEISFGITPRWTRLGLIYIKWALAPVGITYNAIIFEVFRRVGSFTKRSCKLAALGKRQYCLGRFDAQVHVYRWVVHNLCQKALGV